MQSVPIITDVVSSRSGRGVQYYVITTLSLSATCDRWVVFSGTPISSTTKTGRQDITEIFLKVALTTIKQTNPTKNKIEINLPVFDLNQI